MHGLSRCIKYLYPRTSMHIHTPLLYSTLLYSTLLVLCSTLLYPRISSSSSSSSSMLCSCSWPWHGKGRLEGLVVVGECGLMFMPPNLERRAETLPTYLLPYLLPADAVCGIRASPEMHIHAMPYIQYILR